MSGSERRSLARTACRLGRTVRAFVGAKSGSTAIEHTIIAGLVGTAIVASLGMIAGPLGQLFFGLGSH